MIKNHIIKQITFQDIFDFSHNCFIEDKSNHIYFETTYPYRFKIFGDDYLLCMIKLLQISCQNNTLSYFNYHYILQIITTPSNKIKHAITINNLANKIKLQRKNLEYIYFY